MKNKINEKHLQKLEEIQKNLVSVDPLIDQYFEA